MKKLFRGCVLAITALSMVCGIAGCGEEPDDPNATKITMYVYQPEDWAVAYMNSVKEDFNEEHQGQIKLDIRYYFGSQFNANLASAIENGTCPELFTISYSNLAAHVQNGYVEPLNDYFTQEQWDDIIPQSMSQIKFGENIYAYPWYMEPSSFLYYRKDIVEDQLGFTKDDLKTYDGIYEVCRQMVSQGKVPRAGFPIYIPVGIPRGWSTIGMQYNCMNGKYAISDDWTTSNLNEQGLKDLNKFYYTVGSNGWCPQQDMTERGYEDATAGLAEEYWLMNFGGSWDISLIMRDYPDMVDKIGIVPVPTSTTERNGYTYATATNGGWNLCVSSEASTAKKQAAIEFIKFMFTENTERTAQYFIDGYYSRFAPRATVQAYLDAQEKETPQEWLDTVSAVAQLAVPEPRYSWDVINLVNDMLASSMGCAQGSVFDTEYAKILAAANSKMQTILQRGETNPFLN